LNLTAAIITPAAVFLALPDLALSISSDVSPHFKRKPVKHRYLRKHR